MMVIVMMMMVIMMFSTLKTLSMRITRTRRSTFPARPITSVSLSSSMTKETKYGRMASRSTKFKGALKKIHLRGAQASRTRYSIVKNHMVSSSMILRARIPFSHRSTGSILTSSVRFEIVSLSKSIVSMAGVSSGIVERTKVTVERTTTDIEVKANILAQTEVSGYSVRFHKYFRALPTWVEPKSSTARRSTYFRSDSN